MGLGFVTRAQFGQTRHQTLIYTTTTAADDDMETSFALTGKGYVIIAADTTAARSIVKMKVDEDKIKVLGPHLLMAYSGEPGASYLHAPVSLQFSS